MRESGEEERKWRGGEKVERRRESGEEEREVISAGSCDSIRRSVLMGECIDRGMTIDQTRLSNLVCEVIVVNTSKPVLPQTGHTVSWPLCLSPKWLPQNS